jgi:predicted transcriptional regulator
MKHLGPLEQEVMDLIWSHQRLTVREVLVKLQLQRPIAYTTVMTIMNRLVKKGFLHRDTRGKTFIYSARATQAITVKTLVKQSIENLINQFGEQAVAAFIDEVDQLHPEPTTKK